MNVIYFKEQAYNLDKLKCLASASPVIEIPVDSIGYNYLVDSVLTRDFKIPYVYKVDGKWECLAGSRAVVITTASNFLVRIISTPVLKKCKI